MKYPCFGDHSAKLRSGVLTSVPSCVTEYWKIMLLISAGRPSSRDELIVSGGGCMLEFTHIVGTEIFFYNKKKL
jgi:hypothetical protein